MMRAKTTVENVRSLSPADWQTGDVVYVGRFMATQLHRTGPTDGFWGNLYSVRDWGKQAGPLYVAWLLDSNYPWPNEVKARIGELRGKRIACWCAPNPCHAMVLAALADGDEQTLRAAKHVEWWTAKRRPPEAQLGLSLSGKP